MVEAVGIARMDARPAEAAHAAVGWVRRLDWTHPRGWVIAASVAAWASMAVVPRASAVHAGDAHHHVAGAPSGGWVVMVVAMMLPMTLRQVHQVALTTAGYRRHASAAVFLAGYLAVWIAAQAMISGAVQGMTVLAGWAIAASVAGAVAVVWELEPATWRRPGNRDVPPGTSGWRASRERVEYGAVTALGCVGRCWALMSICAASMHSVSVMALLFAVQLGGRHGTRGRRSRVLAATAVLVVSAGAIAARLAGIRIP